MKGKTDRYLDIKLLLAIALGIVVLINFVFIFNVRNKVESGIPKIPQVSLKVIEDSSCNDCPATTNIISAVTKQTGINVTEQQFFEYNSDQGKNIISEYNLKYAPVVVIEGNISGLSINGFTKQDNVFVSNKIAPYRDLTDNEIKGLVTVTYINVSCDKCSNIFSLVDQLQKLGVKVIAQNIVNFGSQAASNLISQYNITRLPALILSNEVSAYGILSNAWKQVGIIESDGSYVTIFNPPPYFNLENNSVIGLVNVTYLTDKSCANCYNVNLHTQILQQFGVYINKNNTVDVSDSEGQNLVNEYKITEVPTIILSKEAADYAGLTNAWKTVGSIESDGSYVFRNDSLIGSYFDLSMNSFVNATK